jgi:2-polyprenyl-3-methyl-5-hydroxy-6-metoxy-1,4-benzoquinol methylase
MILQANAKKKTNKEKYIHKNIESLNYQSKFDFIFSMESLYYVDSIEIALAKIYKLLKPGGKFFCGTDFYTNNKDTVKWADMMKIQMHLHSKQEWKNFFKDAGFKTKTKQVKDFENKKK